MSDAITIRAYETDDFDRLAEIHDAARKIELAYAGLSDAFIPFNIAAEREDLFSYKVFVAETKNSIAGFVAFSDDELAWLYVAPEFFRKGVGKKSVEFALEHTDKNVSVEVLRGNTPALELYAKFGFRIDETVSGVMPGNESFAVTVHRLKR